MSDRHKHRPITFRPPERDRARLLAYVARTGQPLRAVLAQALAQFLDRVSGDTTSAPVETPQAKRAARKPAPGTATKPAPKQAQDTSKAPHRCPVKGWCGVCGEMKGGKR